MKPGYYSPDGGIFESFLYYIPNEVNFAEEVLNVTSVEEYTVDEKEVILLTRGDSLDGGDINHFGRTGYVFFNGTRNYIEFYATDDISDKALENIIAGMSLALLMKVSSFGQLLKRIWEKDFMLNRKAKHSDVTGLICIILVTGSVTIMMTDLC